ncbi:chemotaxis protein CheA [Undibacterium arcticum]|uniref:Chemotaxis protein CheA n=1 Tax=Undibacterium arcticum TaxID=1762892 RepID=A0ABV7F3H4_9BURK
MTIDMSQFFQVFFDEAEELLAEMERLLLAVDVAAPDAEDLHAIFRSAHSIKGGAATFGLNDMTEVTHILESLLDAIRNGELALTAQHVDAFLSSKDILKMQLDGHRHGAAVAQDAVADVRMLLQSLLQDSLSRVVVPLSSVRIATGKEKAGAEHCFRIEMPEVAQRDVDALATELGLLGNISTAALDGKRFVLMLVTTETVSDIEAICSFVLDPDDLKITEQAMPSECATGDRSDEERGYGFFEPLEYIRNNAKTDEQRGYGFFDPFVPDGGGQTGAPAEPAGPAADELRHAPPIEVLEVNANDKKTPSRRESDRAGASESSSIRVSIEKVDQLINLVGELVITQAMIEQRSDGLDPMLHERLLASVSQLTRNTRDLQEAVMSIRMMPMDYVFSRFPRMVRDLAGKLGKKVDFITHGAATELDKGLIERIVDPLTHLVRNSIDHGIEMPAARAAAGKSESGRLFLSACHQGGNIVIEVSDDGGGLNRERILAKAVQQGLPASDAMSDSEVWQLIFAPGFSTAEAVTDVSGRGVGMDVVKRNITAMGGTVDIRSAKGFGTTISISLPLTLAILDGMSVKVGDEIYILPLGFVTESLQPAPHDIKQISGKGCVVKVRGDYLPLIPLYQMFDIAPRYTDPSAGIIVILEADGKKAGLLVDELVGQQQVVVKNLESNYRKVAGISGATILGDGGVSLILDVSALLRSSQQLGLESAFT